MGTPTIGGVNTEAANDGDTKAVDAGAGDDVPPGFILVCSAA